MPEKDCVLDIDTSNYTTSAAVVSRDGEVIKSSRILLSVKKGERGLRQSEAVFQHVCNIPKVMDAVMPEAVRGRIAGVAVSDKPRPRDDSYMPVFRAGEAAARTAADALGVPYMTFSHQEGHIAAIKEFTHYRDDDRILFYHLSGGTTELLKVTDYFGKDGMKIEIIGGTRDISFGQLIDRTGVALGSSFPAGKELDDLVMRSAENGIPPSKCLKPIPFDGMYFNLSGIESQTRRMIENEGADTDALIMEMFNKMAECLTALTEKAVEKTNIHDVVFGGGVSSSRYIRKAIGKNVPGAVFGEWSADNAVGTALLGRNKSWL